MALAWKNTPLMAGNVGALTLGAGEQLSGGFDKFNQVLSGLRDQRIANQDRQDKLSTDEILANVLGINTQEGLSTFSGLENAPEGVDRVKVMEALNNQQNTLLDRSRSRLDQERKQQLMSQDKLTDPLELLQLRRQVAAESPEALKLKEDQASARTIAEKGSQFYFDKKLEEIKARSKKGNKESPDYASYVDSVVTDPTQNSVLQVKSFLSDINANNNTWGDFYVTPAMTRAALNKVAAAWNNQSKGPFGDTDLPLNQFKKALRNVMSNTYPIPDKYKFSSLR